MQGKLYLGIDPSIANTGVVLLDGDGRLLEYLDGSAFTRGLTGFARLTAQAHGIADWLSARMEADGKPLRVDCCYEHYSFRSIHRTFDLAEYGGVLKSALLGLTGSLCLVPPNVNKKFATGSGGAGKEPVMAAAAIEEPVLSAASDDVCDAYFLAKLAAFRDGNTLSAERKLLRTRIDVARSKLEELK